MPIGLLIFKAALSMKYGMRPCIRLRPANVSDALSAATKFWKTVDASLDELLITDIRGDVETLTIFEPTRVLLGSSAVNHGRPVSS
jgi:hypothetical protein